MSKEIAVVKIELLEQLLSSLMQIGYTFENPQSLEISGFDNTSADRVTFQSIAKAKEYLASGLGGIQLWDDASKDIYLSAGSGQLRTFFDGFTEIESSNVFSHFTSSGLSFTIVHDI